MTGAESYISTRGGIEPLSFVDAVMMGLATDGGLLLPAELPDVSKKLDAWRQLSYPELAVAVMQLFVGEQIPEPVLTDLVRRSYATFDHADVVPLRTLGPVHVLELFHGPTLAFKDIALQFLGNLFEYILQQTGTSLNILGATSGDTGSAAIYAVRGKANIQIFIMHPHGKVSPIQERQMTTVLADNVHNIAIEGTFDDGQRIMKEIFREIDFKTEYCLGAVNSVNWARVLAQIVYYFHAAFRVEEATGCKSIQACVPTGNFGDIFAGYIARCMGAPISRLILATNENDILASFFANGVYRRGAVHPTISPSMDIQIASNFERYLYYRVGRNPEKVQRLMASFMRSGSLEVSGHDPAFVAGKATTEETLATIRKYHREFNYLLDPHTAVGVSVAEQHLNQESPTVCLATAHPAKFRETIIRAVGEDLARNPKIDGLGQLPTRCAVLPARNEAIKSFIKETLQTL